MATSSHHPWRLTSGEWKLILLGTILLFLAHGVALIYQIQPAVSLWFPPAGVAIALTLWMGPRGAILTMFVSVCMAPYWGNTGWTRLLGLLDGIEPLVAWLIYRRLFQGSLSLSRLQDAIALIISGPVFASLTSATLGTISLVAVGNIPFSDLPNSITHWWLGNAIGTLAITPTALLFLTPRLRKWGWLPARFPSEAPTPPLLLLNPVISRHRLALEVAAVLLMRTITGIITVIHSDESPFTFQQFSFLSFLPILWAATRFGVKGGMLTATFGVLVTLLTYLIVYPQAIALPLFPVAPELLHVHKLSLLVQCTVCLLVGCAITEHAITQATLAVQRARMELTDQLIQVNQQLAQSNQEKDELLQQSQQASQQVINILESITDGFIAVDRDWRITYINAEASNILGRPASEVLGHDLWKQYPGLEGSRFGQLYDHVMTHNTPAELEDYYSPFQTWYNVRVYPSDSGLAIYFRNTTDSKRIEEMRQQAQTQAQFLAQASSVLNASLEFPKILESLTEQIVPTLADCCFFDVVEGSQIKRYAAKHSNPPLQDWFATQVQKFIPPPGENHPFSQALEQEEPQYVSVLTTEWLDRLALNPEHRQFIQTLGLQSFLIIPLIAHHRKLGVMILGISQSQRQYTETDLALAVDLGQRTALALDNAQLYRHAQEVNRIKDEFLAILSHELRSPLNPILGWTRLLRSRKLDESTVSKALETIERNAKLQAQLVEDLLDVSRILRGKLSLKIETVNLPFMVQSALETVQLSAEAKNIQLLTDFDGNLGPVSGDPGRLQQVVWNLLSNAIKFTPNGGQVTIRLRRVRQFAQLQVQDTGVGIDPEFLPHVFEHFRQADASIARHYGGLGLGLAIVRHLVELHGGTVWVNSAGLDQGTTFTVQLPLLNLPSPETPALTPPVDLQALAGVKILAVDDDPDTLNLLAFILEQAQATVQAVTSVQEALATLETFRPQVLVSDIGMPEEDGYVLMQKLRSHHDPKLQSLPAIALTAYARAEDAQKAKAMGFQRHLPKPMEVTSLLNAIVSLVNP